MAIRRGPLSPTRTNPDKKHVHDLALILKPHVLNERRAYGEDGKHADKVELLESQTKAAFKVWKIRLTLKGERVSEFTYIRQYILITFPRILMRMPGLGSQWIDPSQTMSTLMKTTRSLMDFVFAYNRSYYIMIFDGKTEMQLR